MQIWIQIQTTYKNSNGNILLFYVYSFQSGVTLLEGLWLLLEGLKAFQYLKLSEQCVLLSCCAP